MVDTWQALLFNADADVRNSRENLALLDTYARFIRDSQMSMHRVEACSRLTSDFLEINQLRSEQEETKRQRRDLDYELEKKVRAEFTGLISELSTLIQSVQAEFRRSSEWLFDRAHRSIEVRLSEDGNGMPVEANLDLRYKIVKIKEEMVELRKRVIKDRVLKAMVQKVVPKAFTRTISVYDEQRRLLTEELWEERTFHKERVDDFDLRLNDEGKLSAALDLETEELNLKIQERRDDKTRNIVMRNLLMGIEDGLVKALRVFWPQRFKTDPLKVKAKLEKAVLNLSETEIENRKFYKQFKKEVQDPMAEVDRITRMGVFSASGDLLKRAVCDEDLFAEVKETNVALKQLKEALTHEIAELEEKKKELGKPAEICVEEFIKLAKPSILPEKRIFRPGMNGAKSVRAGYRR
jgi:hypothetical protein